MDDRQEDIAIAERPRDYAGLLWIFAASILGFSLFCGASAVALSDPTLEEPIVLDAENIAEQAFANANIAAELTAQAFAEFIPTLTTTPTNTPSPTATLTSSPTATRTRIFIPSATRRPNTRIPPGSTPTPNPTNTPIVIDTFTSIPTVVDDTETPEPTDPPSDTPPPDTPIPDTPTPE